MFRSPMRSSSGSFLFIWSDFNRASSLICGNKMPTRCNRCFFCNSYCLLNIFRAPLFPSLGARDYYIVGCCLWSLVLGFKVVGMVWTWGLCVGFAGCCFTPANRTHNPLLHTIPTTWKPSTKDHRRQPTV
jgi:hypothetical protein